MTAKAGTVLGGRNLQQALAIYESRLGGNHPDGASPIDRGDRGGQVRSRQPDAAILRAEGKEKAAAEVEKGTR